MLINNYMKIIIILKKNLTPFSLIFDYKYNIVKKSILLYKSCNF